MTRTPDVVQSGGLFLAPGLSDSALSQAKGLSFLGLSFSVCPLEMIPLSYNINKSQRQTGR